MDIQTRRRTRKYGVKAWRKVKSTNHYTDIQTRRNLTTQSKCDEHGEKAKPKLLSQKAWMWGRRC